MTVDIFLLKIGLTARILIYPWLDKTKIFSSTFNLIFNALLIIRLNNAGNATADWGGEKANTMKIITTEAVIYIHVRVESSFNWLDSRHSWSCSENNNRRRRRRRRQVSADTARDYLYVKTRNYYANWHLNKGKLGYKARRLRPC